MKQVKSVKRESSAKQLDRLKAPIQNSHCDEGIDYSDIPKLDETFWSNAAPNPFYKPIKIHASVRIDADVMAWLKSEGRGYQTRMNTILRDAMLKSQLKRSR